MVKYSIVQRTHRDCIFRFICRSFHEFSVRAKSWQRLTLLVCSKVDVASCSCLSFNEFNAMQVLVYKIPCKDVWAIHTHDCILAMPSNGQAKDQHKTRCSKSDASINFLSFGWRVHQTRKRGVAALRVSSGRQTSEAGFCDNWNRCSSSHKIDSTVPKDCINCIPNRCLRCSSCFKSSTLHFWSSYIPDNICVTYLAPGSFWASHFAVVALFWCLFWVSSDDDGLMYANIQGAAVWTVNSILKQILQPRWMVKSWRVVGLEGADVATS